jgi:hypothetical protein
MTVMAGESVIGELDDEFDLDVRIDGLDLADPDRIHRAQTVAASCTACCGTVYGCTDPGCVATGVYCPTGICTGTMCN